MPHRGAKGKLVQLLTDDIDSHLHMKHVDRLMREKQNRCVGRSLFASVYDHIWKIGSRI